MADHSRGLFVTLLLGWFVLVGCAGKQPGSPVAAPASPSDPSSVDRHGAPTVRDPLDVTRYLPQPCTVLTADQLRRLDLPGPGEPDTTANARIVGPGCSWRNSPQASSAGVTFVTGNKNGLADRYRARAKGDIRAYWTETTINGYPAVYNDDIDHRRAGNCLMDLGVSDSLALLVDVQDRSGEKSCDRVALIASMVIATLRGGG